MTVSSYKKSGDAPNIGNTGATASSKSTQGIVATKDEEEMNLLRRKITKVERLVHVPMTTKKEKENYIKKRTKYIDQLGEIAVSAYNNTTTSNTALSRKHNVNSEIKLLQKKIAKVDRLLLARTLTEKEMTKYVAKHEKYVSELGELVHQSLSAAAAAVVVTTGCRQKSGEEKQPDRDDSTERTADLEESFASLSSPPTTPSKIQKMKSKTKISVPPLVAESEMRSPSDTISSPAKNKKITELKESTLPSSSYRSSPTVSSTSSQETKKADNTMKRQLPTTLPVSGTYADDHTSGKVVTSKKVHDLKNGVPQKNNGTKTSSGPNDDRPTSTSSPSAVTQKPVSGGNAIPWRPKPVEPSLRENCNSNTAVTRRPWPPIKTVKSSPHNNNGSSSNSEISVIPHSPKSPSLNNKNISPLSSPPRERAGVETTSTTTTGIESETSPWGRRKRVVPSSNIPPWAKRSSAPPMLQQQPKPQSGTSGNPRTVCCRKGGGGKLAQRYLQHLQAKNQQDYHHHTATASPLTSGTVKKWEATPASTPSRQCKDSDSNFRAKQQTNVEAPAWTEYAENSCYPYRFEHNSVARDTIRNDTMSNASGDSIDDYSENRSIEAVDMEDEEIEEYSDEEEEIVMDDVYDEDEVDYEEELVEEYDVDESVEHHSIVEDEENDGSSYYYEEEIEEQEDCDDSYDSDDDQTPSPFKFARPGRKSQEHLHGDPMTPNDKSKSSSVKMTKEELNSEIFTNLFRLAHKENILESPKSPKAIIGGGGSSPRAKYRK